MKFGRTRLMTLALALVPGFALAAPEATPARRAGVRLFSSIALAADAPALADPPAKAADDAAELKIAGIHGYLFYESLGQLDKRDVFANKMALHNTIIGEGDAKAPSNTTIVMIELAGPPIEGKPKGTLTMTATNDKHVLRQETVQLQSFFVDGKKLSVPFVVVGTGCGTLKIEAELSAKETQKSDRKSRTVEYGCGE